MTDDLTTQLIREYEGFRPEPYWDHTAWRIGYGSDTITMADGTFRKIGSDPDIKPNVSVTEVDADRDLARRIPEFQQQGIVAYVGQEAWDAMSEEAQAAITSLAYNYGSLRNLPSLQRAIQTGDDQTIADAIFDRRLDNDGGNDARRRREAAFVLGHPLEDQLDELLPNQAMYGVSPNRFDTEPMTPDRSYDAPTGSRLSDYALRLLGQPKVPAQRQGSIGRRPPQRTPLAVLPPLPRPRPDPRIMLMPSPEIGMYGRGQPSSGPPRTSWANMPASRTSVPPLRLTIDQLGQSIDNARLNGYREIQQMGPSLPPGGRSVASRPPSGRIARPVTPMDPLSNQPNLDRDRRNVPPVPLTPSPMLRTLPLAVMPRMPPPRLRTSPTSGNTRYAIPPGDALDALAQSTGVTGPQLMAMYRRVSDPDAVRAAEGLALGMPVDSERSRYAPPPVVRVTRPVRPPQRPRETFDRVWAEAKGYI